MQIMSAHKLRRRVTAGSAMTIKQTKGRQSSTFRGCMLRQQVNPQVLSVEMGNNPYEPSKFGSPQQRRNLLMQRRNTSSQEYLLQSQPQSAERNLHEVQPPQVSDHFWKFINGLQISHNQSVTQRNERASYAYKTDEVLHSGPRNVAGKTKRTTGDVGSSFDPMRLNSEKRTGCQSGLSDQNMDLS